MHSWSHFFPYDKPRDLQIEAIERGLESLKSKKFFIIQAGTGVGKSAIGVTIAREINQCLGESEEFQPGSHFITTQKILQKQYVNDFKK